MKRLAPGVGYGSPRSILFKFASTASPPVPRIRTVLILGQVLQIVKVISILTADYHVESNRISLPLELSDMKRLHELIGAHQTRLCGEVSQDMADCVKRYETTKANVP